MEKAEELKEKAKEVIALAKDKLEVVASDERVQEVRGKAVELAGVAKSRFNELSARPEVREAGNTAKRYISFARQWVVVNWNAGRDGKIKVAVAAVVAFFFLKGLFFGWGSGDADANAAQKAQADKADRMAAAALLGAMLSNSGGGGGDDYEPSSSASTSRAPNSMNLWTCSQCGRQIKSTGKPSGMKCPAGIGDRSGRDRCSFRLTY